MISSKFELLRKEIPKEISGSRAEKVPRCMVLRSACTYITILEQINCQHRSDIAKIKQENKILEKEIAKLEDSITPCKELIEGEMLTEVEVEAEEDV